MSHAPAARAMERSSLADALSGLAAAGDLRGVLRWTAHALAAATRARQVVVVPEPSLAPSSAAIALVDEATGLSATVLDPWVRRSQALGGDAQGGPILLGTDELAASAPWAAYAAAPGPHLPTQGWLWLPVVGTDGGHLASITASDAVGDPLGQADLDVALAIAAACGAAIDRLALKGQLAGALAERQAFFGVLSHELRTPITTIYGGARVLRQSGARLSHDAREQLLGDIAEEAERLFRLVEDLLVLSRAEGGALTVVGEPVHLGKLIARVTASEQARWPRAHVVVRLDPALPPVDGEETFIEQVLRNLVSNAAKYAGEAGPIEVTAGREGPWVVVRVRDRGPGLSEEDESRVFQLFYRASATAASAPGAGIGLYACRELVTAMGGELRAGRAPDGGAEFTVRLRPVDVDV